MDLKTLLDTPPWDWPRETAKALEKVLSDRRANLSERIIAAELGGDLVAINDSLASALIAVVGSADEPEELRARAAISLGPVLEVADTDEFDEPEEVPISEVKFHELKETLRKLYLDTSVPKEVRRRVLETSVRAPDTWHGDAVAAAYSSGDREWMLTAVFAMRWIRGFDRQILESLDNPDPEIHFEAVEAAGNWGLDAAWPHVVSLVEEVGTPKGLLLAAIGAAGSIRPQEAGPLLVHLTDSVDEDVREAAQEAVAMAEVDLDIEDDEEEEGAGGHWIN